MVFQEPSAVIFDWDGVLCNSIPSHKKMEKILKVEFGELAKSNGGKNMRDFLNSQNASEETIAKYFKRWEELEKTFGAPAHVGANEILTILNERDILCGALSARGPYPYNFRTFEESGINLSLLSFFVLYNSKKEKGLFVDATYDQTSGKTYQLSPFSKPHELAAIPIQWMLERHHNYPHSVVYVGDNIIDLEYAIKNEFRFVGVLSGEVKSPEEWVYAGLSESNGDIIVNNINELLQILK